MPLLIDGHNLIGQMPDLSLSDPNDEEKLTVRLRGLAERTHKRITVIFDPAPYDNTPPIGRGQSDHGRLSVVYAHPGQKADDVIRQIVGDVRDKQGLVVVTSDAAVADFTRRCGVRVQSSRDFIVWMNGQSSTGSVTPIKPLGSQKEVVAWADVFKEPPPTVIEKKKPTKPIKKKGQKRSEQLKQQVKKIRPLI